MKAAVIKEIQKIISETKTHKDAFAVPELMAILTRELNKGRHSKADPEDTVIQFVAKVVELISASPIYSPTLVRELYRSIIDVAVDAGVPREALLEDLLFQSLLRSADPDRGRRRRQRDARDRIVHAALNEFSEKGFHHSTIDSIAERAGIAKGTVYTYFRTKEDLFNALKEDKMSEFMELARTEISQDTDILAILETVIRQYLAFFEQNSPFFKVIIQEQKDFGREFSEKFINGLIIAFPALKRACWRASRAGNLKQMNYFTAFFGIVGFLNGVIQKWLHEGGQGSLLAEADTVIEVLFHGLAIPPERVRETNPLKVIS